MKFPASISALPERLWSELLEWRRGRQSPPAILLWIPIVLGLGFLAYALHRDWSNLTLTELPEELTEISLFKYKAGILLGILTSAVGLILLTALPILFYFLLLGFGSIPLSIVAAFCAALAALVVTNDVHGNWEEAVGGRLGEETLFSAYLLKLVLATLLLLSPALFLWFYRRGGILVRYLTRCVLLPLVLSTLGITVIWVIFDLADNLPDFKDADTPFGVILKFYAIMVPKMIVEILPVGLLLSMLYALGKLSQSNEIISILGAGRSLPKVLVPCFFLGLIASAICFVLGYHWAPKADGMQDSMIQTIRENADTRSGKAKETPYLVTKQIFRNREDHRVWYIGALPFDLSNANKMKFVHVIQEDEQGRRVEEWFAKNANWMHSIDDPSKNAWWLYQVRHIRYDLETGEVFPSDPESRVDLAGWKETPWMIFSATLDPSYLSVPELASYLQTNRALPEEKLAPYRAFLHNRLANPWKCLAIVLIAAPLSIVFSRRGLLGGVAAAIFFFVGMVFVDSFLLALAQGNKFNPFWAAWLTNLIFGSIGVLLLILRARNRDLPKLNPSNVLGLFRDPAPAVKS